MLRLGFVVRTILTNLSFSVFFLSACIAPQEAAKRFDKVDEGRDSLFYLDVSRVSLPGYGTEAGGTAEETTLVRAFALLQSTESSPSERKESFLDIKQAVAQSKKQQSDAELQVPPHALGVEGFLLEQDSKFFAVLYNTTSSQRQVQSGYFGHQAPFDRVEELTQRSLAAGSVAVWELLIEEPVDEQAALQVVIKGEGLSDDTIRQWSSVQLVDFSSLQAMSEQSLKAQSLPAEQVRQSQQLSQSQQLPQRQNQAGAVIDYQQALAPRWPWRESGGSEASAEWQHYTESFTAVHLVACAGSAADAGCVGADTPRYRFGFLATHGPIEGRSDEREEQLVYDDANEDSSLLDGHYRDALAELERSLAGSPSALAATQGATEKGPVCVLVPVLSGGGINSADVAFFDKTPKDTAAYAKRRWADVLERYFLENSDQVPFALGQGDEELHAKAQAWLRALRAAL